MLLFFDFMRRLIYLDDPSIPVIVRIAFVVVTLSGWLLSLYNDKGRNIAKYKRWDRIRAGKRRKLSRRTIYHLRRKTTW